MRPPYLHSRQVCELMQESSGAFLNAIRPCQLDFLFLGPTDLKMFGIVAQETENQVDVA